MERFEFMGFFERVKRMISRSSVGFVERPKAEIAGRYTGRTSTARIGRHKRVQVGLVDLANVCPTCAGLPITSVKNKKHGHRLYQCANQHTWAD
jgi:hypothetical protein